MAKSISHYQELFKAIYIDVNMRKTKEEIWFRVMEITNRMFSPSSKGSPGDLGTMLPELFAWICNFSSRVEVDLQEILRKKYRNGCPGCGAFEKDCECQYFFTPYSLPESISIVSSKSYEEKRQKDSFFYNQERYIPAMLEDWQEFFNKTYGKRNSQFPAPILLGRLGDEISKLSKMIRELSSEEVRSWRLGSIIAWFFALVNNLDGTMGAGTFSLEKLINNRFKNDQCPWCSRSPCLCERSFSKALVYYSSSLTEGFEIAKKILAENSYGIVNIYDLMERFERGIKFSIYETVRTTDFALILLSKGVEPGLKYLLPEICSRYSPYRIKVFYQADSEEDYDPIEKRLKILFAKNRIEMFSFKDQHDLNSTLRIKLDDVLNRFRNR